MFSTKPFNSIKELQKAFPDEATCIKHLEELRWSEGVVSPFDPTSKVYDCGNGKWKCHNTNKYFNAKTATIFGGSKIPLSDWFLAIFLFVNTKRGISSYSLAAQLNITQKTAWFLLSRIRHAMEHQSFLRELEGTVEVDETFVGGKNKNRHHDKKVEKSQGRSFKDKTPILGMRERDGIVKCVVIPDTKASTIQPILKKHIKYGSGLMTDEWMAYNGMNRFYDHQVVDHGRGQYVNGEATSNRMENFWSHLKRSIIGVYYKISPKHLQKYANEMTFRFNFRGKSVSEKFNLFLQSTIKKRITYKNLVYAPTPRNI